MPAMWKYLEAAVIVGGLLSTRVARAQVVMLLENDTVRVYQATIKAGTSTAEHTHALAHVTYVQRGGTLQIRRPNGPTDTLHLATGTAYWGKVETHTATNIGTTNVILISTDVKPLPARRSP